MTTNGPYSWGNGPQPKRKGLASLLDKAVKLASSDGKASKKEDKRK